MAKRYYSNGAEIESFAQHQGGCTQCAKYDPARTATLALLCLHGAQLLKWKLQDEAAPALAQKRREETAMAKKAGLIKERASKAMLAHVTKYK